MIGYPLADQGEVGTDEFCDVSSDEARHKSLHEFAGRDDFRLFELVDVLQCARVPWLIDLRLRTLFRIRVPVDVDPINSTANLMTDDGVHGFLDHRPTLSFRIIWVLVSRRGLRLNRLSWRLSTSAG